LEFSSFAEIEQEFVQRAHEMVYCCCATVDTRQRPRSRVLHLIWEGAIGWVATGRGSLKAKHLLGNPFVSLAYIADPLRPLYVDCRANWEEDDTTKTRIWELFRTTPPPLGYDPARFWGAAANPAYGLLKLTPWRIYIADLLQPQNVKVWRADT
jgi:Pyridoxamine 5'-phosphate oxidase